MGLLSETNKRNIEKVDIYFVFSGGFVNKKPGKSTKERIEFLKMLLKKFPETPFVFLDYNRGKKIANNFFQNKKSNTVLSNYRYNENLGGTENNIRELISILKNHPEFKKIGIITSEYHEKRVRIILTYYLNKEKLSNIKVYFFHNKQQEIYSCSFLRYLRLILHEIGGIIYFKLYYFIN
ncbi:hypothetical protein TTHT_0884 [Thermotomaculum hydrothermale]|uniref:DUF218 domain-containing protein n=1 Tax=Thermotomaculum hydrothermale TaxID=981385 RepID=A0A7R6PTM6_9BACT|nr:hypothetical protein TTHT_0884 [Thermotomaculum hydrothermale]